MVRMVATFDGSAHNDLSHSVVCIVHIQQTHCTTTFYVRMYPYEGDIGIYLLVTVGAVQINRQDLHCRCLCRTTHRFMHWWWWLCIWIHFTLKSCALEHNRPTHRFMQWLWRQTHPRLDQHASSQPRTCRPLPINPMQQLLMLFLPFRAASSPHWGFYIIPSIG